MNKVMLLGRLTKGPDMKNLVTFTLAVNKRVKEGEERTADFIFCKAFGKTAEFINNYFKKGQQVVVIGRISTGSYEKDGQKVYTTDVIVDEVFFADSKRDEIIKESTPTNSKFLTPEEIEKMEDELPF